MAKYSSLSNHFQNQSNNSQKIISEFAKSLTENVFFRNLDLLKSTTTYVTFNNSLWKMRPQIFCLDVYDDPNFYPVIMLLNNIGSVFQFLPENFKDNIILTPNKDAIVQLLSYSI